MKKPAATMAKKLRENLRRRKENKGTKAKKK